jgi:transcriptional regulator with XRE-family HTH domain
LLLRAHIGQSQPPPQGARSKSGTTAELADFHRTYVSQLERCVTNISIDGLERLAQALEIDVVDLLKR